ncbi:hypothetical protein OUZ56_033060, partial [Daphnia magna]
DLLPGLARPSVLEPGAVGLAPGQGLLPRPQASRTLYAHPRTPSHRLFLRHPREVLPPPGIPHKIPLKGDLCAPLQPCLAEQCDTYP